MCASGYAHATVGSIESAYFIKNGGKFTSLSVQQVIECSYKVGTKGCKGGTTDKAFEYATMVKLHTEDYWPTVWPNDFCGKEKH